MGLIFKEYLSGSSSDKILQCTCCKTHLSKDTDILSKAFHGEFGRAYLMNNVINYYEGPGQDKQMATGLHHVHTIYCRTCSNVLGWKYEVAYEEDQKYKEGKFVLEVSHISPGVA